MEHQISGFLYTYKNGKLTVRQGLVEYRIDSDGRPCRYSRKTTTIELATFKCDDGTVILGCPQAPAVEYKRSVWIPTKDDQLALAVLIGAENKRIYDLLELAEKSRTFIHEMQKISLERRIENGK